MGVYIVTGANRGIGLEYVRQLTLGSGSNTVVATMRSLQGENNELQALINNTHNGSKVHALVCDTSSVSSIQTFAEDARSIIDQAGGRVDVLINNAGINAVPEQSSLSMSPSDLHQHIDVNVVGPAELVKQFSPAYLTTGSVVVNMTSGLGSCGKGVVKCTTYAISKAAVNILSVHQAADLGEKGVKVLCLDPGWVKTRMGGEGAMLEVGERVRGLLEVVGRVGRGEDGGEVGKARFMLYDGGEVPW